jgi:predicted GIY-YIG superfamily endonuclease
MLPKDRKEPNVSDKQRMMKEERKQGWIVYMLRCADGSLYTGITNNFSRRLAQHQKGVASRYTRARLPVEPVYQESAEDRSAATRRELAMKALSRTDKMALVDEFERARPLTLPSEEK